MNEANTLTKTEFDYEIPKFNPGIIVKEKELATDEIPKFNPGIIVKEKELTSEEIPKFNPGIIVKEKELTTDEIPKFNPGIIVKEKELTSEEIIVLFSKVCDKVHWKNEIKAEIPVKDFDKYNQAVMEYTGGLLDQVTEDDGSGLVWVYSDGYYHHIGS